MTDWWEKEESYERTFRTGRHIKNLWKYIPKKVWSGVADAFSDSDGYWVYLEEGWTAYDGGSDCGVIHEYNTRDLKEAIRTIRMLETGKDVKKGADDDSRRIPG